MRVGIFGGTFNPIHRGHVKAALQFLESARLDRLIVIPDKIPPHKVIVGEDHPEQRLRMTELAFCEADQTGRITVSDMELRREGKSYSYYTVSALAEEGTELFLYCGTDMLLSFDTWHRFDELLSLCTLAYAGREVQDEALSSRVREKIAMLQEKHGAKIFVIPLDPIEISSSEIREKLLSGEDASELLPASVYDYIKENKLYQ